MTSSVPVVRSMTGRIRAILLYLQRFGGLESGCGAEEEEKDRGWNMVSRTFFGRSLSRFLDARGTTPDPKRSPAAGSPNPFPGVF